MDYNWIKSKITLGVLTVLTILIVWIVSVVTHQYYIGNKNSEKILKQYDTYYTLEGIILNYMKNLEENKDISKVFINNAKIPVDQMEQIRNTYNTKDGQFTYSLGRVYDLGNHTYRCLYTISREHENDTVSGSEIEVTNDISAEYHNEVIIKLKQKKNAFKILYNKFDLGGDKVYER